MKSKQLYSFLMIMTMVFNIVLSFSGIVRAESGMKQIKVNQTILEFKEVVYVDGTNGNDITGDGSKSSPFATVVKGFDYMNENCRQQGALIIADGEYDIVNLFTGISNNIDNRFNGLEIALFSETLGKVTLKNLKELIIIENSPLSRIKLKFYGIILSSEYLHTHLGGDDQINEFHNCVIDMNYGGYSFVVPTAEAEFYNTIFTKEPATSSYNGHKLGGKAVNCASITEYMDPAAGTIENSLYQVTLDTDYNLTSEGWLNAGSGTNPDGSEAHIGVYGGSFAWGGKAEEVDVPQPSSRTLKYVLEQNEQLQLAVDEDVVENTNMLWTSSDDTVAAISSNGMMKAIKNGNAAITVRSADNSYIEVINVLVVDKVKEYRLTVDLKVGEKCRLTIDDAEDLVGTWTSLDSTVATVTDKGRVSAVARGLTVITGYDEEGKVVGQVYIRVR